MDEDQNCSGCSLSGSRGMLVCCTTVVTLFPTVPVCVIDFRGHEVVVVVQLRGISWSFVVGFVGVLT